MRSVHAYICGLLHSSTNVVQPPTNRLSSSRSTWGARDTHVPSDPIDLAVPTILMPADPTFIDVLTPVYLYGWCPTAWTILGSVRHGGLRRTVVDCP